MKYICYRCLQVMDKSELRPGAKMKGLSVELSRKVKMCKSQLNIVDRQEDPYFENEYAEDSELLGWMPLPDINEVK